MPIHSLELTNVGPFRYRADGAGSDSIKLEFDAKVNLIIGPNNVGKSTILQAVNLLTQRWTYDFQYRYQQHVGFPYNPSAVAVAIDWSNFRGRYLRFKSHYGLLSEAMKRMPYSDVSDNLVGHISDLGVAAPAVSCQYGEWDERKASDFGYVGFVTHTNYRLDILPNTALLARHSMRVSEFDRDVDDTIRKILARITDGFPLRIGSISGSWEDMQVSTQTIDGPVSSGNLSLGTQYVLGWVVRLIVGHAQNYADDNGWRARSGIFIIDDIDAHLHPSWQRRIIPALAEYFPNVQIFASTHSPMIVAGLKKGQVHLLKRDETGQVVWSRNEQDVIGWTADEIYRTFMGIDDPTDERTAGHVEELRQLRSKDSLKPEDEARMQKLRRLVNEDLLARGAHNAQQERFDQMMQEYLRSRTSDLSQDGS